MAVAIEAVNEAIYWRGLFTWRYAAFEFAIADLVSRAALHEAYLALGVPPFGPARKLKRLRQLIEMDGPLAAYYPVLSIKLDEFAQYAEHRNFLVHGIMVPHSSTEISFQMYDHREGVYSIGELHFEMQHLKTVANLVGEMSREFADLTVRISRDIPLAAL